MGNEPGVYLTHSLKGRQTEYKIYCARALKGDHSLSIPEPNALKLLRKKEERAIGSIGFFNPQSAPNLMKVNFEPYEDLMFWDKRKLYRTRLAARLELKALEHLKSLGFDGYLEHDATSRLRRYMLYQTGRLTYGKMHIDEEIAALKQFLNSPKSVKLTLGEKLLIAVGIRKRKTK
ncbi:MAG: hypothetical protein V1658_04495 [Candidatus Micrarchaeota archaeon]